MKNRRLGRYSQLAIIALAAMGLSKFMATGPATDSSNRVRLENSDQVNPNNSSSNLRLAEAGEFARARVQALLATRPEGNGFAPSKVEDHVASASETMSPRQAAQQALKRLMNYRKCERLSGNLSREKLRDIEKQCPVNHPEALQYAAGYSQVLVDQTVMELAFLRELVLATRLRNIDEPFDVAKIAKVYIQHSDDNVREQAVALAEILPEAQGQVALEIASAALKSTVSGPLASQAVELLERHRSTDPELADRAVMEVLRHGGWDVKSAVASQSLPFLNSQNRGEFVKLMNAEPERSKLRLHLRLNLEEFDRQMRL
jgi:hypothetical protein